MSTERKIISLSDQINQIEFTRNLLVNGNNALKLEHIPDLDDVILNMTQDDGEKLKSRAHQLADQIYKSSVQLKSYYDRLADKDQDFASYWNREPTFTHAVSLLPEARSRGLFRSYEHFFKRNALDEREELSKHIDQFDHLIKSLDRPDFNKGKLKRHPFLEGGSSIRMTSYMFGALSLGGIYYMSQATIPEHFEGLKVFARGFSALHLLITGIAVHQTLYDEKVNFEKLTIFPLNYRAELADKAIDMIKTYSK